MCGQIYVKMLFHKLNAVLASGPVLMAPNFDRAFKIAVDASDSCSWRSLSSRQTPVEWIGQLIGYFF